MTLGQKIKKERKSKKITQEALTGGRITRNMLSAIENDKATPSLDTLRFIAMSLEVPLSYLVSESDDLFFYKKAEKIELIKDCFYQKSYKRCIDAIKSLGETDDELSLMLSVSYFELGKEAVLTGSLKTAIRLLEMSAEEHKNTVYAPEHTLYLNHLYSSVAKNIKSPLLELETEEFEKNLFHSYDIDFYKFIIGDTAYSYSDPIFSLHIKAKLLIKERKYSDALTLLREVESAKTQKNYNSYLILNLYADIESCYKQLADFENAYKYSTKRMTLMEQFNS